MKKLISGFFFTFFLAGLLHAQFNSDSWMVGASSSLDFGLLSYKEKDIDEKTGIISLDFNPRLGYFIQNRVATGMDMYAYYNRRKFGDNEPNVSTEYRLGLFGRYYYKTVGPVVPFGEAKAGLGRSAYKYGSTGEKTKHNILYFGAGAGAAFFLADNFALEGLLMYNFDRQANKEMGGWHRTHGIMLNFGFTFFFNSLLQV